MAFLILRVEPVRNGRYRFGMADPDKQLLIPLLFGQNVYIELPHINRSQVANRTFFEHGRLVNPELNQWIQQNNYVAAPGGRPVKLIFELRANVFKYYHPQAH